MRKLLLAATFAIACVTAGAAVAQEKQGLNPAQQVEGQLILETARNLVSYGETKSDPLALVMAAKMMAGVPGRVLADGADGAAGADKAPGFDLEGVLKKAEEMAQGDELITKVAADVRTAASANSKAVCYWQYYCYWNGYCEYAYYCW